MHLPVFADQMVVMEQQQKATYHIAQLCAVLTLNMNLAQEQANFVGKLCTAVYQGGQPYKKTALQLHVIDARVCANQGNKHILPE